MYYKEKMSPSDLNDYLQIFQTISLDKLESHNLLHRFDIKFAVDMESLPYILNTLSPDYKILEINGLRSFKYYNLYFDTNDYSMYLSHHNGKLNRYKVRYRKYLDAGTCFFEIKRRSNNAQTIKTRMKAECVNRNINGEAAEMVTEELGINPLGLIPKLTDNYKRITLLKEEIQEKITIDLNVNFKNTINENSLPNVALIEIKQKRIDHLTESMLLLRSMDFRPVQRLSKYCIGMVLTNSISKYNRFKPTVMILNKIMGQEYEF